MCFDGVKRLCHIRGKLREKKSGSISQTLFWLACEITRMLEPTSFSSILPMRPGT